jgi:D-alanyl-D-alanine carboxypeptidase
MTCIVCLFLAKKYDIDIEKKEVKVSRKAGMIPGTSANLKNGDLLTVKDLLYGMMLPSGNDAAYCLA